MNENCNVKLAAKKTSPENQIESNVCLKVPEMKNELVTILSDFKFCKKKKSLNSRFAQFPQRNLFSIYWQSIQVQLK
jgi:hypothetical protein